MSTTNNSLSRENDGNFNVLLQTSRDPRFFEAFQRYFAELGITVRDWDGLFAEMDRDAENRTFLRLAPSGAVLGFLQCQAIPFTSWFFTQTCGFIREFWIDPVCRGRGHGTALLREAETYFSTGGIRTVLLTTNTAADFYRARGYVPAPDIQAKNRDPVYRKHL